MLEILLTKGIPASGKSTFAKKLAEQGSHTRVNKDDLRAMLHASVFTEANEKFVLSTRDFIVEECLRKDLSVVVDDTNFDGQHFKRMCLIAEKYSSKGIVVREKYFPIELSVAHERNEQRVVGKVPRSVIDRMYKKYVEGKTVKERFHQVASSKRDELTRPKNRENLPLSCVFDIDGTTALMNDRSPFDKSRYNEDSPNPPVIDVILTYYEKGYKILFVSGRDEEGREITETWLKTHLTIQNKPIQFELFMRRNKDTRNDSIIKKELYQHNIENIYNVIFWCDDRDRVVKAVRELGIPCFQVAYGDF